MPDSTCLLTGARGGGNDFLLYWTIYYEPRDTSYWNSNTTSKVMVFNFTKNYKFTTRLTADDVTLEIIMLVKLLGVLITDDLTWDLNTESLVRRANGRLRILHRLVEFSVPLCVGAVLPRLAQFVDPRKWTGSREGPENSLMIILKSNYKSYENALKLWNPCRKKKDSLSEICNILWSEKPKPSESALQILNN